MEGFHSHPSSPPQTSTNAPTTSHLRHSKSLNLPAPTKRDSETSPSRQSRLLHSRNARFPAKKLSLSSLSSRFSQLIHANEEPEQVPSHCRDQENVPLRSSKSQVNISRRYSGFASGVHNDYSSSTLSRKFGRKGNIVIHEDSLTPERPLLERSPSPSPTNNHITSSASVSPIGFDHLQDSIGNMRLREISGNEFRGSPLMSSPLNEPVKAVKKRKLTQIKAGFNAQEYIEHLEKELENAKSEMYSPTTNRSLKDQLHAVRSENSRLRQDMAEVRESVEAELKRTIEHQVEVEVELKRKVRELEDQLDQKESRINDLEQQHDERRLDFNIMDTLKAAIDRLEQDKLMLEDENRSMTKRNEVLSELLAMSPTKLQSFDLRSPTRDRKKAGRPMSMIIPKQPSSPSGRLVLNPSSAVASPTLSANGSFYNPFRVRTGSPPTNHGLGLHCEGGNGVEMESRLNEHGYFDQHPSGQTRSRRSTLQSQASISDVASTVSKSSSPSDQPGRRVIPRRKPRKFMSGSTQLKPLLLPTLTGDGLPLSASSTATSPRGVAFRNFSTGSAGSSACSLGEDDCSPSPLVASQRDNALLSDSIERSSDNAATIYRSLQDVLTDQNSPQSNLDSTQGLQPSYCSADETILEHHSSILVSSKPTYLADCSKQLQPSPSQSPLAEVSPSSSVDLAQPHGFDLNALDKIGLPVPAFEALPSADSNADESLWTDVPRPLFSLQSRSSQGHNRSSIEANSLVPWGINKSENALSTRNLDLLNEERYGQSTTRLGKPNMPRPSSFPSVSSRQDMMKNWSRLSQRSSLRISESLTSSRQSGHLLHTNTLAAKPLAALTIKTIFRTISQCTSHIRDFKRDPLALARRVIANAWFSNWKRLGRLSWWVLGLFISSGTGRPKLKEFQWDQFDGEEIARRVCEEQKQRPILNNMQTQQSTTTTKSDREDLQQSDSKQGWGESVVLWGKFSVAIMMAVGGAVVKGPGEMLKEIDGRKQAVNDESSRPKRHVRGRSDHVVDDRRRLDRLQTRTSEPRFGNIPRPFVPSVSSTSSLVRTFHGSTLGLSNERLVPKSSLHDRRLDDDETLRAFKSPRKHVADYFRHGIVVSHRHEPKNHTGLPEEDLLGLDVDEETPEPRPPPWSPSQRLFYSARS